MKLSSVAEGITNRQDRAQSTAWVVYDSNENVYYHSGAYVTTADLLRAKLYQREAQAENRVDRIEVSQNRRAWPGPRIGATDTNWEVRKIRISYVRE